MRKFLIVIPARYNSKRLPGKPLIKIKKKTILERTFNQCLKATKRRNIIVATDNKKIFSFCENKQIPVLMTSKNHKTGTDRITEVSKKIKCHVYINIQGDEPFFNPKDIKKLIKLSCNKPNIIMNGYTKILNKLDFESPNIPKVIFDKEKYLLYMSRSSIPGNKNKKFVLGYRQVCAYAFPRKEIIFIGSNKNKTQIENIEDIEILRFLELGKKVKMVQMSSKSFSIDTANDLKRAKKIIKDEEPR